MKDKKTVKSAAKKVSATKSEPVSTTNSFFNTPTIPPIKPLHKNESGGDYIGAITLIAIGTIFLLNNFGIIPWEIWGTLWRFWPVFIVMWGIELIFGKSWIGKLISGTLVLIIVGGIISFALLLNNQELRNKVDQKFPGIKIHSIQDFGGKVEEKTLILEKSDYPNIEKMEAEIEISSGTYTLTDTKEGKLISAKSKFNSRFYEPKLTGEIVGSDLKAKFEVESKDGINLTATRSQHEFVFGNPEVRTDLKIDQSSGNGKITLKELNLGALKAHTSSGTIEINLGKNAIPSRDSTLEMSSGSMGLYVPAEVGVKVVYSMSSGVLKVNGISFRDDGTYYTEGYDAAETKMTVNVHMSSGNMTISNK